MAAVGKQSEAVGHSTASFFFMSHFFATMCAMIVRSFIAVVLLIAVGFSIGVIESANVAAKVPQLASLIPASQQSFDSPVVRCADEVDTTGWKTFGNIPLAFTFQYPAFMTVVRTSTGVMISDGSGDTVTLTKSLQSLNDVLDPSMQQGSWKIADRNTYALTTPYLTNDDGTISSTYLFIRNFPQHGINGDYDMVHALLTLRSPGVEADVAHAAGVTDPETVLNPLEQVLSTFRFLQNDEINPKAGGE